LKGVVAVFNCMVLTIYILLERDNSMIKPINDLSFWGSDVDWCFSFILNQLVLYKCIYSLCRSSLFTSRVL